MAHTAVPLVVAVAGMVASFAVLVVEHPSGWGAPLLTGALLGPVLAGGFIAGIRSRWPDAPMAFTPPLHPVHREAAAVAEAVGVVDLAPRRADDRWSRDLRAELAAVGWERWQARTVLELIDTAEDPGHPGHTGRLYAAPSAYGPFRVLAVEDGSPDPVTGLRPWVGLVVPARCSTVAAAAACLHDLPTDLYAHAKRT
jgi:hypothetical protein